MHEPDVSVTLDESTELAVEELRTIRDQVKALKTREEEIRNHLLSELDNADQGVTASGTPIVTIDRQTRTRLDSTKLQALYPDAWKACQKDSVVSTVRLPDSGV